MSTGAPTLWNEAVVCAACGTGLLPLTYALPEDDDLREGRRPHLQDIDLVARRLAVTGTSVRLSRRTRELLGVASAEPLRGDPKTARGRRSWGRSRSMHCGSIAATPRSSPSRAASSPVRMGKHWPCRPCTTVGVGCSSAGVPIVRPHDARHTTATLLLGQGVYPKLVSEMLGHATVAITLDLYSHATPATHREGARVLDTLPRPQ